MPALNNGEPLFKDHLKPGQRVWIRFVDPENQSKTVTFGSAGELTYSGYQYMGTATFLLFDRVIGSGKKTKIETLMINAVDVKHIGTLDEQHDD